MLMRRLILLFFIQAAIVALLALRLGQLQLSQTERWRQQAQMFVRRHYLIETARGSLLDVKGRAVALDRPCWDLAIDYRAMNHDDRWISAKALARLKAQGLTDRKELRRRLPQTKAEIDAQIDSIPMALAQRCNVEYEDILARYQDIRRRMNALRQNLWSRQYDRNADSSATEEIEERTTLREEFGAHTIVAAVPDEVAFYFEKHLSEFPGLIKIDSRRRVYPYRDVAAQVLGTLRPVDPDTYKANPFNRPDLQDDTPGNLQGYLPGDRMGTSGMEKIAERQLRGTRGFKLIDLDGQEQTDYRAEPKPGADVTLTLDMELQREIHQQLADPAKHLTTGQDGQRHPVALVILRLEDSQILTALSWPSYDLNLYDQQIRRLMADSGQTPLLNRTVACAYPPGSTVKPLVATAAITQGVLALGDGVTCHGHLFPNQPSAYRCWIYKENGGTHGLMHVSEAIEQSCNIFFYTMGDRLGYTHLIGWYKEFGFGSPTGCGLGEEVGGILPSVVKMPSAEIARSEAIFLGIGQGKINVSPMQMANAYATMMRGGAFWTPRFLLESSGGPTRQVKIAPESIEPVRRGLFAVVNGDRGTARILRMSVGVAGKTGSATAVRTVSGFGAPRLVTGDDAWFVGMVPAEKPQFVIAAVMEFGGHGGAAAAPLARQAIMALEHQGYLPAVD